MYLLKLTRANYDSEIVYVNPKYIISITRHTANVTEVMVYPAAHPMLVTEKVEDIIFNLRSNA